MTRQTLSDDDRKEVVLYRLEKAQRSYEEAVTNILFSLRMTGDYEDRKNLDMDTEVLPLVKPAKELIDKVSQLTREKIF